MNRIKYYKITYGQTNIFRAIHMRSTFQLMHSFEKGHVDRFMLSAE